MRLAVSALLLGLGAGCMQASEPDLTYVAASQGPCPEGATVVSTASAGTTCAKTSAANLAVGNAPAMTKERVDELRAQVEATGEPAAYTDGDITVTVYPKQ